MNDETKQVEQDKDVISDLEALRDAVNSIEPLAGYMVQGTVYAALRAIARKDAEIMQLQALIQEFENPAFGEWKFRRALGDLTPEDEARLQPEHWEAMRQIIRAALSVKGGAE